MSHLVRPPLRGLYFVTPEQPEGRLALVAAVLAGGGRWIQYRDKQSTPEQRWTEVSRLLALCREQGAALIINDDLNLAARLGADGVHLGATDPSLAAARAQLGPNAIIGASCYGSLERAREAHGQGANYVAFGAVFPSATKPGAVHAPLALFTEAKRRLPIPICGIGGITPENAAQVIAAGADLLAVVQGISAADEPQTAARSIQALFA